MPTPRQPALSNARHGRLPSTPPLSVQGAYEAAEIIPVRSLFDDRRSEPRYDCDDRGCLLFFSTPKGKPKITPCHIIDQSASGARVGFQEDCKITPEIWLIDLDTHSVRRGQAAWSMPYRMGLRFNLILQLSKTEPKPTKVPQNVYDTWLELTGGQKDQSQDPPKDSPDDSVLFLD